MKRLLLFCLTLVFWFGTTMAQPAFPINGMWNKSKHFFTWGGHGQPYIEDVINYVYKINGLVSSGSNTFYKLYNGYEFVAYIKTTDDKAWYGSDTANLVPLFDYTLQVGDTFLFPYSSGFGGVTKLTVSLVDEVMVSGLMRKRITFSNFYQYPYGPVWLKGIGDSKFGGLEFDYAYTVWDMNYSVLECFTDDGQAIYGNCTVGVQDLAKNTAVCTFNPDDQSLYVNNAENKPAQLEIYSIAGVKIFETNINQGIQRLSCKEIKPGMYITRITQANRSQTQKFIKH